MRVRHQNVAHCFTAHRVQNGGQMRVVIRSRIDDRNALMSNDKTVRTGECERPGIVAGDPPQQRRKRDHGSEPRFKIPVERDVIHKPKVMVAPTGQPN